MGSNKYYLDDKDYQDYLDGLEARRDPVTNVIINWTKEEKTLFKKRAEARRRAILNKTK